MDQRMIFFTGILLLALGGCGDGSVEPAARGSRNKPPLPSELPLLPPGAPGEDTGATGTVGQSTFSLLGPALPEGVTVARQRVRLTSRAGVTFETESTHPGNGETAIAITAGTYTVEFLGDEGNPTGIQETVTISAGENEVFPIGSLWITPASAVQPGRAGTAALQFRLATASGTLRSVPGALNTVIDVPANRPVQLFGLGVNGELPPVTFNPGTSLLPVEFGSIFVRRKIIGDVQIRGANGVTLFPETSDFVEYLLPTTTQSLGCMVYQGTIDQLTTQTFTLCSDATNHVLFDAR